MEKLIKRCLLALCLMGIFFISYTKEADAATINYKYIDGSVVEDAGGTPVVTDNTVTTTDFTEAKTEIGAANILAFVEEDAFYKGLYTPVDTAIASGGTVVVVTKDKVTAGDTLGTKGIVWFIYNDDLYIVSQRAGGSDFMDEAASPSHKGSYDREITFPGEGFNAKTPSMEKGDTELDGYGMYVSSVGDEATIADNTYYTYKDDPETKKFLSTGTRSKIDINNTHCSVLPKQLLKPSAVPWAAEASSIKKVYMGTDITVRGNIAGLFNLNVSVPDGYINVGSVGESEYSNLEEVKIYSDLSEVTSMAATFARCPKLESVCAYGADGTALTTVPMTKLNTAAFMFYGDDQLLNTYPGSLVNVMDLSSGTLENTMYMFAGCEKIDTPVVKDYNMSNVVNIDGMFQGAKKAKIVFTAGTDSSVANWDTGNVQSALYTFMGVIPNLDTPNVNVSPGFDLIPANTVVDGVVDLSLWDLSKCVSTYHMFAQNLGVTGVSFGTAYDELVDASGMFNGCDNLASASMKNAVMNKLKYAYAMFRRAGSATTGANVADLEGWTATVLEGTDFMFENSGFSEIKFNGSSDMSTVKEMIAMFADCPRLTSLGTDALSHWRLTAVTNTKYMFDGDTALTKVTVTNWGMPTVEDMSYMFMDCQALSALNTGSWTIGSGAKKLKTMEGFAYNTGIDAASMTDWDTSQLTNMYMAFAKCPELATVSLPSMTNSFAALTDSNGAFYDDPKLTAVGGNDTSKYAAPNLVDARGMFCNDIKLVDVGLDNFVKDKTSTISYMFRNCAALEQITLNGWDTSNVAYMQGLFDGCKALTTATVGASFKSDKLKDMGEMFRNCYKLASPSAIIEHFTTTTLLEDMYHTFENCYAMTTLDISHMNLANTKDLRHLAYMAENADNVTNKLVTIKLPSTIMTAAGLITSDASDGNGTSINMFWVDEDGVADGVHTEEDADGDLLTTLYVKGDIPDKLKAYNFGGTNGDNDNRSFVKFVAQRINGENRTTYTFTSPTNVATLAVDADSTLFKGSVDPSTATKVPVTYTWKKGTTTLPETDHDYDTQPNAAGEYKTTAMPDELTGSNTKITKTFTLSAYPTTTKKIVATYTGPNIVKGQNYSKDNVKVVYTDAGGVDHNLAKDDWTVNSQTVANLGDNTFTVTYNPGDGNLTDTFVVTGVAAGEPYISATYTGGDVVVGENYKKSDVTVHFTTAAGTTTKLNTDDFTVDSLKVTAEGDNTFTASYVDPDGHNLHDTFKVKGVKPAAGITATYKGGEIPVGSNYSKSDVEVILTLADGTKSTLTPDDFTVDSLKVTKKGNNTFTVTYETGDAKYTDTITVPGKRVIGSIVSTYSGPAVLVGNEYNTANVTTMAYYSDDVGHTEGFQVTPTSYSTTKVNSVGDNAITATYTDPDQGGKAFTSVFKVNGYKTITSIGATYTGDKIKVGESYKKKDVKLTLYYADGTTSTTENFTVDSLVVTGEGSNSYTATYRDPFGNTYTAGYTVPGYKKDSNSDSSNNSSGGNNSPYAGVSSVYPGTGYAASLPVLGGGGGVGVASGVVQTGATGKAVLYTIAFIALVGLVVFFIIIRKREKDKD
jgi:surface protein